MGEEKTGEDCPKCGKPMMQMVNHWRHVSPIGTHIGSLKKYRKFVNAFEWKEADEDTIRLVYDVIGPDSRSES